MKVLEYMKNNYRNGDIWSGKAEVAISKKFNKIRRERLLAVTKMMIEERFIDVAPAIRSLTGPNLPDTYLINIERINEYFKELETKNAEFKRDVIKCVISALVGSAATLLFQEAYKLLAQV